MRLGESGRAVGVGAVPAGTVQGPPWLAGLVAYGRWPKLFAALLLVLSVAFLLLPSLGGKRGAGQASAALFDGRARSMTMIRSLSSTQQSQAPSVWSCLCFGDDDISLVPDSRFGKVYSITAGPGSHNPWASLGPGVAAAEVSVRRPVRLGRWDWYANSFKALPGWTLTDWGTVEQMNYPTLTSPPLEIDYDKYGVGIDRSIGEVATVGGKAQFRDVRRFFPVSEVIGKWLDFVVGVRWATDTTGAIRVYTRCIACRETHWVLRYSRSHIVTMQWGGGILTAAGRNPNGSGEITTLDKQGLYYGFFDGHVPSVLPTNHILEMGFVRTTSEAAAKAAFQK
jgi:hypothetical protein